MAAAKGGRRERGQDRGPPTVIAIASGTGGVGRTTVTANLAVALGERGRDVLVLDADFVRPSVDLFLGLERHGDTSELIAGARTVEEILVAGPPGVHLVPGGACLGKLSEIAILEPAALIWALDAMPQHIDVLLIDTAAGPRAEVVTFARAAHHAIVVVCDEPASTEGALAFITTLSSEHAVDHFKVIASQTRTLSAGAALYSKLRRACDRLPNVILEHAGTVPYEDCVAQAIRAGRSALEADPNSRAARAFRTLAARVDTWARPIGVRGHLEFFIEQLVNAQTHGINPARPQEEPGLETTPPAHSSHAARTPEAVVRDHTGLVQRIAYQIMHRLPRHVEVNDLIQVGMISLLEAARRYAPDKGASFETYVGIRIRGAILDYVRSSHWSPRSLPGRLRAIASAKQHIGNGAGEIPKSIDVAAALGISIEAYHRTLTDAAMSRLLSLDERDSAGGESIGDQMVNESVGPAEATEQEELRRAVAAAINSLPERERAVLFLYHGDGLLFREIGDKLKVSESRVCQIHGRAVKRLRALVQRWTPTGKLNAKPVTGRSA
jgi:flagellar biosynthesis protein FlhG